MDLPIVQMTRATSLAKFEELAIASLQKVAQLQNGNIDRLGRKVKLFEHFAAAKLESIAYITGPNR